MGSCQPCHPGPPLLGSPRAAVGVTAGAHGDLRKPLSLQAAVAEAWLIHKDICKCREPLTVWLVHARRSERGTVSGHVTGQRNKTANMQLNKRLLNGHCVPGMYTGPRMLPWCGYGSPEKGVGRLPEHTQQSDAISCLQFKTRELKPTHPRSSFSFLTPGSLGCPHDGHLSQVAGKLSSFLRAAWGPLSHWWPSKRVGSLGPHQAAGAPGAPQPKEVNDDLWGQVYTPEEGVLLSIHPGVKGQSRIFTKRRDDEGKH